MQIYLDSRFRLAQGERMTNEKQLRVALYARVSTVNGKQDTENQLQQLREFCRKQEWQIVGEYIDHASGKRSDRPQFQKMFGAASRREFDCLLFWSLDSFSREGVLETLQHLQRLTANGVAYILLTGRYIDSLGPFSDVIISLLASLARQERIRLSERVLAGLARAKHEGRIGGRPRVVASTSKIRRLAESGTQRSADRRATRYQQNDSSAETGRRVRRGDSACCTLCESRIDGLGAGLRF